jgi:hypothetical protein
MENRLDRVLWVNFSLEFNGWKNQLWPMWLHLIKTVYFLEVQATTLIFKKQSETQLKIRKTKRRLQKRRKRRKKQQKRK